MTPDQVTIAVSRQVADRLELAVDSYVYDLRTELRDLVAKPVGRSGSKIIRSKPGEPPRRETGKYQASIKHTVTVAGNRVRGEAGTPMLLRVWFRDGTARMAPRPHFAQVYRKAKAEAAERIKQKL